MPGPQNMPKLYIRSQFSISETNWFFFSCKNINLGDHFFQLQCLGTLFSKIMHIIHKMQLFLWSVFIFGQKSCFIGPPRSKLHNPTDVSNLIQTTTYGNTYLEVHHRLVGHKDQLQVGLLASWLDFAGRINLPKNQQFHSIFPPEPLQNFRPRQNQ